MTKTIGKRGRLQNQMFRFGLVVEGNEISKLVWKMEGGSCFALDTTTALKIKF